MSKRFLTLDYIFLYICLVIILWMYLSYSINKNIPRDHMIIKQMSGQLEVRDYKSEYIIGKEINFSNYKFWFEIDDIKNELKENNIEIIEYPFYLQFEKGGRSKVFFDIKNGQPVKSVDGFVLNKKNTDVAYVGFNWYPTKRNQSKTLKKIDQILDSSKISYDDSVYWVEVVAPMKVVPFMAHNGVFVHLK